MNDKSDSIFAGLGAIALIFLISHRYPRLIQIWIFGSTQLNGFKMPTSNNPQAPSFSGLGKWAGAFALLSIVAVSASHSDRYSEPMAGIIWLVALGSAMWQWNDMVTGLADFGIGSTTDNQGQKVIAP